MKTAYQKHQGFEEWILPQAFRVQVTELSGALKDGLTTIGLKVAEPLLLLPSRRILAETVKAVQQTR